MQYSIVIPAYNESKNLQPLLEEFSKHNTDNIELIIIDNASVDNTKEILEKAKEKYSFLKIVTLEINEGYGNGIKQGISQAKGDFVGWMHADLQDDVADVFKAIDIIKNSNDSKIFVKGLRNNRTLDENLFTLCMSILESILLKNFLYDINAQPNMFNRNLINLINIDNIPKDWLFDLFFYYSALKNNYKIIRFKSNYRKRLNGKSCWNKGIMSKIKLSIQTIKNSIKLKNALQDN